MKSVEWSLDQAIADVLFRLWGTPRVDLFATSLNSKLPLYCSRLPDPNSLNRDPMTMPWDDDLYYLFPPISMTLRALSKIRREEAEVIAILPWWPSRGWFPLVLEMLIDHPVLLPLRTDLLTGPGGESYPSLKSLHLAAWRLSGKTYRQGEFLQQLQKLLKDPSGDPPDVYTTRNGMYLSAGAKNGISIRFIALPM